ncbi:MAG: ABC transporter ATP-binding protein [Deltaproteobacteria bacterium]|nr:ABC transporter ATP-binding protein [Deltaproteobacteria bacterium]
MLVVDNVEIIYNDVILAVKGVSLRVPEREIVTLLGANGAGKSTVLKSISGVLKSQEGEIESGEITYNGKRLNDVSAEKIVRMGICQVPEGRRVFRDLTSHENLKAGAFTRKDRAEARRDIDRCLEYFPRLRKTLQVKAGYLSGGEQQMLAISRALMGKPRCLLLDEPSLGLAPLLVKEIFAIIGRINEEEGLSILLVEQNANMALQIAGHGYIMENGRMVMDDPCDKLRQNEDVMEFYLGITAEGGEKSFADVKHYKRRKRWLS